MKRSARGSRGSEKSECIIHLFGNAESSQKKIDEIYKTASNIYGCIIYDTESPIGKSIKCSIR